MGEVRSDCSSRFRAAYGMAGAAAARREHRLAAPCCFVTGVQRGLRLGGEPGIERGLRHGDRVERHEGMGATAIFRALTAPDTGLLCFESHAQCAPGNHIELAAEARHPEAVDHVVAREHQSDTLTHWKPKLVRALDPPAL